jgi:hypothetical protein
MTSTPTTPAPAARIPGEPTHGCVRCGASIPIAESMCEQCNPLGLPSPSASQAHGIAILGVAIAVVLLAIVGRVAVSGIGPFTSSLVGFGPDPAGIRLTISVTNGGSSANATTCRVSDPEMRGIGPETAFVGSPIIDAGATVTFDAVVTTLGTEPRPLTVDCSR